MHCPKMTTTLQGLTFPAKEADQDQANYRVTLQKTMTHKFFRIMKLYGSCRLKIQHDQVLELNYRIEKCPNIIIVQEIPADDVN